MRIFTSFLLGIVCFTLDSFGQTASINTAAKDVAAYPVSLYKDATAQSQNLYNGRQYYVYDARNDEHQFLNQRKWHKGVVYYDSQQFDSIPMLYDIFHDELVVKHFNGDHILLQSEKVDHFMLDDHNFERLEAGKTINAQMRTGFYDIIYNGPSRTIVRRAKQRQEKIVDKTVIALYPQKNFYYIQTNGKYNSVHSKKSVFNLFPEHKKELRKVLRDQKIKYRKNREMAITQMVATHDELAKR
jgi:surface antigen